MNGHGKLIDAFGPSAHQPETTLNISIDGIMAQHYLSESVVMLLVEDNRGDVVLLKHAFSKAGMQHDFLVAKDGQEAIEHLSSSTARTPPRPMYCPISTCRAKGDWRFWHGFGPIEIGANFL